MKKFLSMLLLFFGLLGLLAWGMDFLITRQFKKMEASPFANWNDIYNTDIKADILIMGSSRAYVQFNPRILDSVLHVNSYNLGMDGRAVESQVIKYHVYRHEQKMKPQLILFEVYQGTMDVSNGYQRLQFVPYLTDSYLWRQTHKLEGFSWADAIIPCWRYRNYIQDVKEVIDGTSYYCRPELKAYKGFCDSDKPWDGSMLARIDTIIYSREPEAVAEVARFLEECQQEQIQVVFVVAPYYIGATRKIGDLDGWYGMISAIAEPFNVPILDYTYDSLSYDTAYFYNASHLNQVAAALFTQKLAHDLDSLGLVPRR